MHAKCDCKWKYSCQICSKFTYLFYKSVKNMGILYKITFKMLTDWNTEMLSACCLPVTKGHNWHIDYLSVTPLLSWVSGMYLTCLCSKQSNYVKSCRIRKERTISASLEYKWMNICVDQRYGFAFAFYHSAQTNRKWLSYNMVLFLQ